jgi:hypothetical protein
MDVLGDGTVATDPCGAGTPTTTTTTADIGIQTPWRFPASGFPPRLQHGPPPIPPPRPIKTSTPLEDPGPPPEFINASGRPLEFMTKSSTQLEETIKDLLHTFSQPSLLQTIPTIFNELWWDLARQEPRARMAFLPRTCVGRGCDPCSKPRYYGIEECTCGFQDEKDLDINFLLSTEHRRWDSSWNPQDLAIGEPWWDPMSVREPETAEALKEETNRFHLGRLKQTKWLSELFLMLESNSLVHIWKGFSTEKKQTLNQLLTQTLSCMEGRKDRKEETFRECVPKIQFMTRMRQPAVVDKFEYSGSLNPFTGYPLRPEETWEIALENEWRNCCNKRANAMVHIQLLDEVKIFLEDALLQEEIASTLKDLQVIVDSKMERDDPCLEQNEIFFQTAMAVLCLQYELLFRKETLRIDLSHLIFRLDNAGDRLNDILVNGRLEDYIKDDSIFCCRPLNTARGCRLGERLPISEEKRLLVQIYDFTTQEIGLLQNGLRRTLILEEIFQRLSTQILYKMQSFPMLKNVRLIPKDFDIDDFMARSLKAGPMIQRCKTILGRVGGRLFPLCCFGCTRTCSTSEFARL